MQARRIIINNYVAWQRNWGFSFMPSLDLRTAEFTTVTRNTSNMFVCNNALSSMVEEFNYRLNVWNMASLLTSTDKTCLYVVSTTMCSWRSLWQGWRMVNKLGTNGSTNKGNKSNANNRSSFFFQILRTKGTLAGTTTGIWFIVVKDGLESQMGMDRYWESDKSCA